LHVQGVAGHPGQQGGGPKRIIGKMEGRGGGEAQGVADPPKKTIHRRDSISGPLSFLSPQAEISTNHAVLKNGLK
jgi:hypothetical protein